MSSNILLVLALLLRPEEGPEKTGAAVPVADSTARVGAYYTGVYPDLFVQLLGKRGAEVRAKVDTAFNRLFFGDNDTARVYYPVEPDMAYIEDIGNNDVRTEGMSYGMMIAVQLDRKDIFDRLWKWAKTHMYWTTGPYEGYFSWHCKTDGARLDSGAASDGEEWFAMSLFFASARWGNGEGIFDYREEAQAILHTMLHKEEEAGHGNVTTMFNAAVKLVAFVPKTPANMFTDPSYQLPHYYELWARWADTDNGFWCDAVRASRKLLRRATHPTTGLSPDYAQFDGRPLPWGQNGHSDFRFDAWRVAMNVAVDWLWFCADRWEVTQSNRLLAFFRSQGIRTYGNQYTLAGKKLGNDHSTGLVAMNAVAALSATRDLRKRFVAELWNTRVPTGRYRYYDGMLYMLGMLQVSGNFRIYDPTGKPVPACGE